MKVLTYFKDMARQAEDDFRKEYEDKFGLVFLSSTYAEKFVKTYASDDYMDNIVKRYVAKTRQFLINYGVYNLSDSVIWNEGILAEDRSVSNLQYKFNEFFFDITDDDPNDDVVVPRVKARFNSNYFPTCLYNDIMSLCDFVLRYLNDNNIATIQFVYEKDAAEAEALYANLKDSIITDEDIVNVMASIPSSMSQDDFVAEYQKRQKPEIAIENREEMARRLIELDPRKEEYYKYIFENFPKAKYEIAHIAKYLSVDLSDQINKDINNSFNLKKIASEEDALKMKEALDESMSRYGITKSARKDELDKMLTDFDIKARTYEGNLYNTREECNQAKKDDMALYDLHGDLKNASKDECKLFLIKISETSFGKAIKEKHCNLIKDRITCIDKDVFEKMLEGLDEKNEAECNTIKTEITNYDAEEDLKESFFARIDKRIKNIWEEEDFNEFSMLFMQTKVSDYFNINKNIEYIREKGRTETKEKFIHAFLKLNEEDVTSAAKYVISKDGGMLASLFNMGKKDIYETLTLNERVLHPSINEAVERVRAEKEANKGKGLFGAFSKIKAGVQSATTAPVASTAQSSTTTGFKFCTECGNKIAENSKFCPNCGSKQD